MTVDPIVDQLWEARIVAGLTQMELADKAGVSQPSISRIESGKIQPTLKLVRQLAEALGLDIQLQPSTIPGEHP